MKKSTILLLLIAGTIYYSCKSTKTISNPLWNGDCPFAGLEFTYVEEVDSFSRALNFNDSLTVGLKADLEKLKGDGKIGNNLNVTIDKFKSESRTRKVEIDDEEYVKWLQDKTKTLCGLHGQLKDGGIYTTKTSRAAAESTMLDLIKEMSAYSEKKKKNTQ